MNTETMKPSTLFDKEVMDQAGNELGTVDGVWIDDATNQVEFIGVKSGSLLGKAHLLPAANADLAESTITVPYAQEHVKSAPSFGTEDELSPEDEDVIYSHYGLRRSTAPSPSALPDTEERIKGSLGGSKGAGYADRDMPTPPQHVEMNLYEEELQVGKRTVAAGHVRLRKVVRTEHQEVPVELRREEVHIERVPAIGQTSDSAFEEQEIDVPVMREEAVVGRETHATEEVRLKKTAQFETETVGDEIRREDVEVDRDGEMETRR